MSEIQVFPPQIWILYLVSLACCCIGFFRFVWFMSVGYGLSSAGIGAALLVLSIVNGRFDLVFAAQCVWKRAISSITVQSPRTMPMRIPPRC